MDSRKLAFDQTILVARCENAGMWRRAPMTVLVCVLVVFVAWPKTLFADFDDILPFPENGWLKETVLEKSTVTVWPTDKNKNVIVNKFWPLSKEVDAGKTETFGIPTAVQLKDDDPPEKWVAVTDVRQRITKKNPGATADLEIEALYFDSTTSTYALGNIFGAIAKMKGFGFEVLIPDLFADINGGGLGADDILYSLVDLTVYLNDAPSFAMGDQFNVVNGTTSGLPGMYFSTTPFAFDSLSGFTGTAYTGTGTAEGIHGATAVPEPAAMLLLTLGLASATAGFKLNHRTIDRTRGQQ